MKNHANHFLEMIEGGHLTEEEISSICDILETENITQIRKFYGQLKPTYLKRKYSDKGKDYDL